MSSHTLSPLDAPGVDAAVDAALAAIAAARSLQELKEVRIAHTGARSPLALANRAIKDVAKQGRASAGKTVGQARGRVSKAIGERQAQLEAERDERILQEEAVDVTLPSQRYPLGARHPLSRIQEEISDFFVAMGWEIAEGPLVEHEWFNFDALNFAADHPARQMQDTFFVEPAGAHLEIGRASCRGGV